MRIKLKVLSPVHIGSGGEINPIEYLIDGNRFIRLDMDNLFKDQDFKPIMDKFIELAKEQRYIGTLLPKDLLLRHPLYSLHISSGTQGFNPTVIKSFIKSAGRVFIPGSSFKESMLSAVMYSVLKEKGERNLKDFIEILDKEDTEFEMEIKTSLDSLDRWSEKN